LFYPCNQGHRKINPNRQPGNSIPGKKITRKIKEFLAKMQSQLKIFRHPVSFTIWAARARHAKKARRAGLPETINYFNHNPIIKFS
jgi:hypothetical protein